jgi:hypothetical protein
VARSADGRRCTSITQIVGEDVGWEHEALQVGYLGTTLLEALFLRQ